MIMSLLVHLFYLAAGWAPIADGGALLCGCRSAVSGLDA